MVEDYFKLHLTELFEVNKNFVCLHICNSILTYFHKNLKSPKFSYLGSSNKTTINILPEGSLFFMLQMYCFVKK